MSTSNIHQESLADAGSETRPLMLERGSYIPWDLRGNDFKYYEAKIEVMNLILISIPNDIYNSVYACKTAKSMWQRVERLMRRTVQNKVDKETRFNNEFDQFVAEPVLNCLQPEWLKYVTQVRLAKRLTEDTYDDLFDYLHQFEKLVNASRAKKVEKSHDSLALVAHIVPNNSKDSLTLAMILFACAITQRFSNPTINYLCTSSNTRNQAIVQSLRVNIQSKNSGNDGRNTRRSYVQEEIIEGNNVQNDAGNIQRTLRTTSSGTATNVQCYNCSEKGHYARNFPKPQVRDSKYFMEQMLLAKQDEVGVILTDE
ncbi:gag-pol polyprotein [Tanacetum coccineum]